MADRFDGVQTRRASSDFAVLGRFQSTTFMPTNLLSHKRQEWWSALKEDKQSCALAGRYFWFVSAGVGSASSFFFKLWLSTFSSRRDSYCLRGTRLP